MKNLKMPHIYSVQKRLLLILSFLSALFFLYLFQYFNEKGPNRLIVLVVIVGTIISTIYQYYTVKSFHIRMITSYDFNKAFKHALSVNGVKTSPLVDGLFKMKRLQVEDSNIILLYWHSALTHSATVTFKNAKDTVLYDKILASMNDCMKINNIPRYTKYSNIFLAISVIIVAIFAVGFAFGYPTDIGV